MALLLSLTLLGSLSVLYAWNTYDLGGALAGLVGGQGESATGDAVEMAVGTRDLPPTGSRLLWDVLWVVTHPDNQRTDRILTTYDVLYKNMPDRPTQDYWPSFEDHPNLYRTAFENRDVLIVERR